MATVRIYKIAELLNMSSQDVVTLLRKESGIEVKSASSTIEEVVAREFVARLARQRNLTVPTNASFADSPAASTRLHRVVSKGKTRIVREMAAARHWVEGELRFLPGRKLCT